MAVTKNVSLKKTKEAYYFLNFAVQTIKLFQLWDGDNEKSGCWNFICKYSFVIVILPNTFACFYDLAFMPTEDDTTTLNFFQVLLAIVCIIGEHYAALCFLTNRKEIRILVDRLADFQKFSSFEAMVETDKKAVFYTKLLMLYSAMGSLTYSIMPLLSKAFCEQNRTPTMIKYGIPCGLVCRVRLPFRFDYTPLFEFMYLHQVFLVFVLSWVLIALTMLLSGLVMHLTHHIKMLRMQLNAISHCPEKDVKKNAKICMRYHAAIINYCDDINAAFGSQMVLHIMLTSFIISILGFVLIVVNKLDFLRFAMHLCGWLFLLLIACYSGQTLIDESIAVSREVYNMNWYNFPTEVQKDLSIVLIRSQKPLTLNALKFGFMSFETFLKVIRSAYSYLTLLINLR